MKNIRFKIISLVVLMTMALTSCLNDLEDYLGGFSGGPATAEFNEYDNSAGVVVREIINPTAPATFVLRLNIASVNPFKTATKITVAIDTNLITKYNAANGFTSPSNMAKPLPAASLTVGTFDVTIPANKREADWSFTIDATKVPNPVSTFYLLAVKIVSVDNGALVSGNYGTKLVRVLGRNKYDGIYTVTGTMVDLASASITGNYPATVHLVTSGNASVIYNEPAASPWGSTVFHTIKSGGSLSVYGSFGLSITFDASDNVSSIVNTYGQPAGNTRSAQLDPSGVNKWNSTTRNVQVKYFMIQPSSVPTPPSIRTTFDETWTYVGPRPAK
jgi:hypothetical protein